MRLRATLLGMLTAAVAVLGVHLPFPEQSRLVLGLLLGFTASAYIGALLAQSQGPKTVAAEILVGAAVFACAVLGMTGSALWLAIGYFAHGVWDWLHESHTVPTRVVAWFPPWCAAVDFTFAVFVAGWIWRAV